MGATTGRVLAVVAAAYFIGRAVVEPFTIDLTDPGSYRQDWGGPHLVGVLAVHCGPGLVAAVVVTWVLLRRARSRRQAGTGR